MKVSQLDPIRTNHGQGTDHFVSDECKFEIGAPYLRTANLPESTLLEQGELPLCDLAALSLREGRRPRPIYTAHKWFARRLGTVFRALLVGATSEPQNDFWEAYYGKADLRGLTVLDPFVGGGTSVVEAGRLGASTIGVDVDPIACSVTKLELMAAELPNLEEALTELTLSVGEVLRPFHMFKADGREYQVLHYFWVQVLKCVECETDFDAHPNFQLARNNTRQWVFCQHCGNIEVRRVSHKTFGCGSCGKRTTIMKGHVDYGKATCPYCGRKERLIEVGRRTGSRPQWRQFAVEVLGEREGKRSVPLNRRYFFVSGKQGEEAFAAAREALQERMSKKPDAFPGLVISDVDRFDSRLIDYGYQRWAELFNDRQLLHLSLLAEAIKNYKGPLRKALNMAFSDHLTTNCMLTSYAAGWRRLTPLFSIRAFRHIPRPIELNPWVDGSGRGSYPNTIRKLMRASCYARSPKEPLLGGGFQTVESVEAEATPRIECSSSRDLAFLEAGSVDLVLTDPPYFDNIAYSELSEFFLPWLRFLDVLSADSGIEQVMIESLVGRRKDPNSLTRYTCGLSDVFEEISRVLKPSGIVVFSYRHTVPAAWLALAKAITAHQLAAVRVLPAPGEAGIGLHAHPGTGLWDAVFVFRRNSEDNFNNGSCLRVSKSEINDAKAQASAWLLNLANSPLPFIQIDRLTLQRAALVAAALSSLRDNDGDFMSLEEALIEGI